MQPQRVKYLATWTEELLSKANRVRQLIGDKHWLSDGHQKEYLIRDFLARHLPASFIVARGFVCPPTINGEVSKEIDVLVANPEAAPPWLYEGGLVISPPNSVVAHIHVKTSFSKAELLDTIQGARTVQEICRSAELSENIWSCACFFSRDEEAYETVFSKVCETIEANTQAARALDFIVVLDGPLIILTESQTPSGPALIVRGFDTGFQSFAIAFADFFARLASIQSGRPSDWYELIQNMPFNQPLSRSFQI